MIKPSFGIVNNQYTTLKNVVYKDVFIPKGFTFDGVTCRAPFTILFSTKNLRLGLTASCVHDYMCQHKDKYKRNLASKYLRDIWIADGLSKWKGYLVYTFVELYQIFKGWK